MIRLQKLSKRERIAVRKALRRQVVIEVGDEAIKDFTVGETQTFDLSDPAVAKFFFGVFWEDCVSVPGSPEAVHRVSVIAVDADKGVITCR